MAVFFLSVNAPSKIKFFLKIQCNSLILLNRISRPSVCTFNYTSISNSLRENPNEFFASIHIAERKAELILKRQFVSWAGAGYFVKKSNEVKCRQKIIKKMSFLS